MDPTIILTVETVPPGLPVTWSSSDPSIATVSPSGVVTALKAGDVTITATLGDISSICTVHIRYRGELNYSSYEMYDMETLDLALYPGDAENVTWRSSNSDIATVDETGYVVAVNPGVVHITANSPDLLEPVSCTVYVRFGERLYWIQNVSNSYRLTSQSIRTFNNTTVVQDGDNSSLHELNYLTQLWRITHVGDGYYSIRPAFKLSMGLYVDDFKNTYHCVCGNYSDICYFCKISFRNGAPAF